MKCPNCKKEVKVIQLTGFETTTLRYDFGKRTLGLVSRDTIHSMKVKIACDKCDETLKIGETAEEVARWVFENIETDEIKKQLHERTYTGQFKRVVSKEQKDLECQFDDRLGIETDDSTTESDDSDNPIQIEENHGVVDDSDDSCDGHCDGCEKELPPEEQQKVDDLNDEFSKEGNKVNPKIKIVSDV